MQARPSGAVDAEVVFSFAPTRERTPCDATKQTRFAPRALFGFDKNVIARATCPTPTTALVDALKAMNAARWVNERITETALKNLREAGVRGVRFNFIKRLIDKTPRGVMQRTAMHIAALGYGSSVAKYGQRASGAGRKPAGRRAHASGLPRCDRWS